jgi:hypothetical protein
MSILGPRIFRRRHGFLPSAASFIAPLTSSATSVLKGARPMTFTRASTAFINDHEGFWRPVPSGALRRGGAGARCP